MPGYKNCYYDPKLNKIHLKEYGSDDYKTFDYSHWFYLRCEEATGIKDIFGNNVKRIDSGRKIDTGMYNMTYEHNIHPTMKFLEAYYKGQDLKYDKSEFNIGFIDIECGDSDDGSGGFPYPETAKNEINLITVYCSKTDTFTTFAYQNYTSGKPDAIKNSNFEFKLFRDETDMLKGFSDWFKAQKLDFLTGWNMEHFDIPYIVQRFKTKGMSEKYIKQFSPFGKVKVGTGISKRMQNEVTEVTIEGLTVITYEDLYAKFSGAGKPESWSLQWFGEEFLGEGKLELDGSVNQIYKTDWEKFVQYNIQDVNLVKKLDEKFKYVKFTIMSCFGPRCTFDKILAISNIITGDILNELHSQNKVLQDEGHQPEDWWLHEEMYKVKDAMGLPYYQNCKEGDITFPDFYCKGAIVEAYPGLYHKVLSNDIKSSYPHQILMHNISPETKVIEKNLDIKDKNSEDFHKKYITSPINGVYYLREFEGIIPTCVRKNFTRRKEYSKIASEAEKSGDKEIFEEYDALQYLTKILINSYYGVLLLKKGFALSDIDNARVITRGGRNCLRWLGTQGEEYARNILPKKLAKMFNLAEVPKIENRIWVLGDTDSCYMQYDEIYKKCCSHLGHEEFMELVEKLMNDAYLKILKIKANNERIPDIIKFPRELFIDHMIVTAKKKYIKKISRKDEIKYDPPKNSFTGIELKRSDTPNWVKERVMEGIDLLLASDNIKPLEDFTIKAWKEYKNVPMDDIARKQGVGKYDKFAPEMDEALPEEKLGTTMSAKAAINYNWLLQKYNPGLLPIEQGNRIKYLSLKKNQFDFDVIGWQGHYPKEFFDKLGLVPNLEETFDKTFNALLSRITEAVGWTQKGNLLPRNKGLFS